MSTNDSSLKDLLQQHFSVAAVARDPEPIRRVLQLIGDWLTPGERSPYPAVPLEELARVFAARTMPEQGMGVSEFLDEFARMVVPNTARLNHPRYIGHMTQALPWISVAAEALTAALNQNQVKVETAYVSTLIEKQVLGWMHRRIYSQGDEFYARAMHSGHHAVGNIVSGGTTGNLTALAVALETRLPGYRKIGLLAALGQADYRGLAVVGSTRMHYSLKKCMATLGLGEQALHMVRVDADNRIDIQALEDKLSQLRCERIVVVAVVGIAGTTETGAVDPLPELAEIAQREGAWFHVDGAWGGALLLSDHLRPLLKGIERADSVVIDGHKLLWVPMAQGMVLFKNELSLDHLRHHANYIIRSGSNDLGQTSLEGSRRFDALKLWTSFNVFGTRGYTTLLDQVCQVADSMRALLLDQEDFELTSDSRAFIFTYRFVPLRVRASLARLIEAGDIDGAAELNGRLNLLNARLQEVQKGNGKSFVSRTVLESLACPQGITVLRAVLTNVLTMPADLRAILEEQNTLGTSFLGEFGLS
jgi:putative pyridoxal-dependent aspartate 1-decarboxylase